MAVNFLAKSQSKDYNQVLSDLTEILSKTAITDEADKSKLLQNKNLIKAQSHSPIAQFKDKLKKRVREYKHPFRTIPDCISEWRNSVLKEAREDEQLEAIVQSTYQSRKETAPGRYSNKTSLAQSHQAFCQIGQIFYEIPADGSKIDTSKPLSNPLEFSYNDVKEQILVKTPCSNQVHLLRSLDLLLDFGEKHGIELDKIGEIVKQMICEELPHYSGNFFNMTAPTLIIDTAVGLVSYQSLISQTKKSMAHIQRQMNENIEISVQLYRSCLTEAYFLEHPNSSDKEQARKIELDTIRILKKLVEPNTSHEISLFQKMYFNKYDYSPSLETLLEFCTEIEQQEEFALKSVKTLDHDSVPVNCFNLETHFSTETDLQANTPHLSGDANVECYMSKYGPPTKYYGYDSGNQMRNSVHYDMRKQPSSNVYLNKSSYPGRTDHQPQSPQSQPHYDSRSVSPSAPVVSPNYEQASYRQGRYDRFHNKSPVYYRTNSGNFRVIDDNKRYRLSPSGKFRERSKSPHSNPWFSSNKQKFPSTQGDGQISSSSQGYETSSHSHEYDKNTKRYDDYHSKSSSGQHYPSKKSDAELKCTLCFSSNHNKYSGGCPYHGLKETSSICSVCDRGYHEQNHCLYKSSSKSHQSKHSSADSESKSDNKDQTSNHVPRADYK